MHQTALHSIRHKKKKTHIVDSFSKLYRCSTVITEHTNKKNLSVQYKKGVLPTAGLQKGEEKANQITFALAFTI